MTHERKPQVLVGAALLLLQAPTCLAWAPFMARPRVTGLMGVRMSAGGEYNDKALSTRLRQSGDGCGPLEIRPLFDAMTAPDSTFMKEYFQKKPYVSDPADGVGSLKGAWTLDTMKQAIDKEFLSECWISLHLPLA